MRELKKVAIMYDFDKTLSKKYMSEYGFIQDIGFKDNTEFWHYCNNQLAENNNMDSNLAFMLANILAAQQSGKKITKEYLKAFGKNIEYFDGVLDWFDRINEYGRKKGLQIEHYIISSGVQEIIEGTKIYKHFSRVFASSYIYNNKGEAMWPRIIVNYTAKTQFIFRIRKNLLDNLYNDVDVNKKTDAKTALPYTNMIYFGDGETDIPCMRVIKDKGGHSICLYNDDEQSKLKAKQILKDNRVDVIAKADYTENSKIDKFVKRILTDISKKKN